MCGVWCRVCVLTVLLSGLSPNDPSRAAAEQAAKQFYDIDNKHNTHTDTHTDTHTHLYSLTKYPGFE